MIIYENELIGKSVVSPLYGKGKIVKVLCIHTKTIEIGVEFEEPHLALHDLGGRLSRPYGKWCHIYKDKENIENWTGYIVVLNENRNIGGNDE